MTNTYTFKIHLISDAFVSSGDGFGTLVDADIVFDQVGLPYIPARRLKGCLKAGLEEVKGMLAEAGVQSPLISEEATNSIFGKAGSRQSQSLHFEDLRVADYEKNRSYLEAVIQSGLVHAQEVLEEMTRIRQFTALDNGVADPHSLRSIRVIQKGETFMSSLHVPHESQLQGFALACQGLQELGLGAKRRRGFGKVHCELLNKADKNILPDVLSRLKTGVAS